MTGAVAVPVTASKAAANLSVMSARTFTVGSSHSDQGGSAGDDVFRLQAFLPVSDGKADALAILKGRAAAAVAAVLDPDGALMNKYLFTRFPDDETETLGSIEPFYRSGFTIAAVAGLLWLFICRGSLGWFTLSGSDPRTRACRGREPEAQVTLSNEGQTGQNEQCNAAARPEPAGQLNDDGREQKSARRQDEKSSHDTTR